MNAKAKQPLPQNPDSSALPVSDAEFELFRKWLYSAAGIHLADAKKMLVSSRLGKRVRMLGLNSFRQYFELLSGTSAAASPERQTALDLLTTNETYFFRETGHFDYLRQSLIPRWKGRSVRCWSAASSSGEEAYTLAMVLAAQHAGNWEIVGTDISSRMVAAAQHAVYPMERTGNIPSAYLHEHCRKGTGDKNGTFRIAAELRSKVRFQLANLQQPLSHLGQFDLIFLRNVMIYFDAPSKQRVIQNVLARLKPDGLLFIGHAESLNGVSAQVKLVQPAIYQWQPA